MLGAGCRVRWPWSANHCTPADQCSLVSKSLHSRRSMLAPQSLNPNICGRASRSGWMGEAKRRSVGDRKRAESPTEGHNTLFFVARRVIAAIPTYNTLRYQTKTHTCDRLLRGRDRGDQPNISISGATGKHQSTIIAPVSDVANICTAHFRAKFT